MLSEQSAPAPVVTLTGVGVSFRSGPPWRRRVQRALSNVDLHIQPGEILGVVGESGSGKTTIGRLVVGLATADHGAVVVERRRGSRRNRVGDVQLVLQHPEWALNPYLRVGRSVGEPLAIRRVGTRAERWERVGDILELVGLERSMAMRYPHELSGGQQQRAAIARALITEPRLVVFDEAVSALDVSAQAQVLNLIQETQRTQQYAALFISHDMAVVRYIADRIVVLYRGRVVAVAPAASFYAHPRHPYAAGLLELENERAWIGALEPGGADTGCPFASSCPLSDEACRTERPALRRVGDEMSACHHAEVL